MFESVRRNKRNSFFILFSFIFVVTLLLYFLCIAFSVDAYIAITIAFIFSIITSWSSYYFSDKIILSVSHARPATLEEDRKLVHILDALMLSAGLKYRPKLYVMDEAQPNAFATGRNQKNSIICVTTGLLEKLDYYELEGVLAHEMGHIKNYDILLSAIVTVLVGLVVMVADIFSRSAFRFHDRDNDSSSNIFAIVIGLILLIISPILSKLMQLAISRKREFLADATAIEITRNPQGLISALRKLDASTEDLQNINKATAHMYIVNPLKATQNKKKRNDLFSTHPSIEQRIEALEHIN